MTVDGTGKSSTYSTTATVSAEGKNTLVSSTTDYAGNTSATNTNTALIDTQASTVTNTVTAGTKGKNGWYTSAVNMQVDATDATSGVDTIQYTTNGAGPTTVTNPTMSTDGTGKSSTFSTNTTLAAEGTNTVASTSTDYAGNTSTTATNTVKIDTVAPTLVKTINGAAPRDATVHNGWYNAADVDSSGNLNVTLAANDTTSGVHTITYTKDGVSTTSTNSTISGDTASSSHSTSLTINKQGTTSLTHETEDMAGNTYVLTAQDVKLDTILPTLVKSVARTGLDKVTVTLKGADDTSGSGIDDIVYSQDGGTAVTVVGGGAYSKDTTFVITGTGAHDLTHSITDIAGNQFVLASQTVAIGPTASGAAANQPNAPQSVLTVSLQNGPVNAFPVTSQGTLLSDADVASPDGLVTASIPAGTTVLNADGSPAYLNKDPDIFLISSTNAQAPAGYQMISSYQMYPSGVTMDSPVTLAINYDESMLPKGTQPVIAYFDEKTGNWVDLETAGYIAADGSEVPHCATTRLGFCTRFALLAK
jgi:hypothetical protein